MSLDYNITKCDPAAMSNAEWPTTHGLIFATMAVGLGTLSEKTLPEWKARTKMLAYFNPDAFGDLAKLTPSEWRMRFGLYTNVTNETRGAWLKRTTAHEMARIEREHRATEKEAAAALTNDCV